VHTLIDVHTSVPIATVTRMALTSIRADRVCTVCIGMASIRTATLVYICALKSIANETQTACTRVRTNGVRAISVGVTIIGTNTLVNICAKYPIAGVTRRTRTLIRSWKVGTCGTCWMTICRTLIDIGTNVPIARIPRVA